MDHQLTFADSEFNHKRRQTRKEKFLGRMEKLIPGQPIYVYKNSTSTQVNYQGGCTL